MAASIGRLGGFASAALCATALGLASCSASRRPAPAPTTAPAPTARLSLDPEASPLPFRWLADDAVLVAPTLGERKLAGFGNYVARAARKEKRAGLTVWDDEQAWKLADSARGTSDKVVAHRRAEYLKDDSLPEPVDRFLVFSREGEVIYQRDFRTWPLTELD
jgi:hypothetical protein